MRAKAKPGKLQVIREDDLRAMGADLSRLRRLHDRLWRWLGFGPCAIPEWPRDKDFAAINLITEITARLNWRDRLRLLVSGRLRIVTNTKTMPRVKRSASRTSIGVMPPGGGQAGA